MLVTVRVQRTSLGPSSGWVRYARLPQRNDAVKSGHRGMAETLELREHEPHPVAALAARLQLRQDGGKHRFLGGNEAFEVEWIGCSQF